MRALSCVCTKGKCCVPTDSRFCSRLASDLCGASLSSIGHVVTLTIRYKLFSSKLFQRCNVLASTSVRQRCLFVAGQHDDSLVTPTCYLLRTRRLTSCRASPGDGGDTRSTSGGANYSMAPATSAMASAASSTASRTRVSALNARGGRGRVGAGRGGLGRLSSSPRKRGKKKGVLGEEGIVARRRVSGLRPPSSNARHGFRKLLRGLHSCGVPPSRRCTVVLGDGFKTVKGPI